MKHIFHTRIIGESCIMYVIIRTVAYGL